MKNKQTPGAFGNKDKKNSKDNSIDEVFTLVENMRTKYNLQAISFNPETYIKGERLYQIYKLPHDEKMEGVIREVVDMILLMAKVENLSELEKGKQFGLLFNSLMMQGLIMKQYNGEKVEVFEESALAIREAAEIEDDFKDIESGLTLKDAMDILKALKN